MRIDHGSQIQPPFPGPQIRYVTDPDLIQSAGIPFPFDRIGWIAVGTVDDGGGLPFLGANTNKAQFAHRFGDRLPANDLAVVAQIGQDLRRPRHTVRPAVKPSHFLLDLFGPDSTFRRFALEPGIESRPRNFEQTSHPCDREITLLSVHQFERLGFVSEASWAKKSDAFFRKARSSFRSETSLRSCTSSARSDRLNDPSPASWRALNRLTHRPNICSFKPSSRATRATGRPVSTTSFTASSLYSGENSRR